MSELTLAESLHRVEMVKDEWHEKHQGTLDRILGIVWSCGDCVCGCTQAQIIAYFNNAVVSGWYVPRVLWEGRFFTDHEIGAEQELVYKRDALEANEPEMAVRIRWI